MPHIQESVTEDTALSSEHLAGQGDEEEVVEAESDEDEVEEEGKVLSLLYC